MDDVAVTAAAPRAGSRRWVGLGAWALWALALLGLGTVPWFDHRLRQAGDSPVHPVASVARAAR